MNYWTVSCRYVYGGLLVVNTTVKTLHSINMKRVKHLHQSTSCAVNESGKRKHDKPVEMSHQMCVKTQTQICSAIPISNTHTPHVKWWASQEYVYGRNMNIPDINWKRVMQNISDDTCVWDEVKHESRAGTKSRRKASDVPLRFPFSRKIVGIQMAHNFNCKAHPNLPWFKHRFLILLCDSFQPTVYFNLCWHKPTKSSDCWA